MITFKRSIPTGGGNSLMRRWDMFGPMILILLSLLLPSACFCPATRQTLFIAPCTTRHQLNKKQSIETKLHVTQRVPSLLDEIEVESQRLSQSARSTLVAMKKWFTNLAIRQFWWCVPMALITYPLICAFNGSYAQMPSWWAMSNLNHLHSNKIGHLICTGFLFSNIFYFLSGLHLLNVIPLQRKGGHTKNYYPILGWLVLCSGVISFVYHTFQTVGLLIAAESLCFVDHGLAISAACCFFEKCGWPSVRTLIVGVFSLGLLTVGADGIYPIIHSCWHMGSATASVLWASDGENRRKRHIMESLKQRRLNRVKRNF